MEIKIRFKRIKDVEMPMISSKGDWIDLYIPRKVEYILDKGELRLIPLGIAMKLPNGFEAILAPRSSTAMKHNILLANSIGVIDNSYCGNNDEWGFMAYSTWPTRLRGGDRICQFRIQLSQKATFWQKLKWLLSSGVRLVEVDKLDDDNRSGFGSTGT